MTKRIIAIMAALLLALSLFACKEPEQTEESTTGNKIEITTTGETTSDGTESGEGEGSETEPAGDLTFDPVTAEDVYVLHKNKAVTLHNTPSYNDGSTLSVANGTKLSRTGISVGGEWSRVEYEGQTYYIASQAVTTLADLDEGFVEVDKTYKVVANVNVRIAPEVTELADEVTQYNVIGSLKAGDTIKVIAENTAIGWLKIEYECDSYDGACYVRYNEAWYEGDETESTETSAEETTEAESESTTETAAPAGK